ncbi:MAG: RNB domain-containing ribonuclease, partial [Acidimicrobiia bacterium]|nr:RNB domain-containing ribonuclease [Acidimicrobiia bacterium]
GVSLRLPAQEIARQGDHYVLEFDQSLPVEGWNAQISLLAGMLAGQTMFDAGVGVLRTLPPAHDEDLARLRRTAAALGLHWPDGESYADFVRDLRPETAAQNAFLVQCTRLFKGAGYYSFDGHRPDHPEHGAIAAIYSHVTAPLRRLVDRFGNEVVLALCAGSAPPSWALDGLGQLPSMMGQARQRESSLERALLDMTEVLTLEHQVGETFEAVVVDVVERRSKATVQIPEPAVVAEVPADGLSLADQITLRLSAVHVDTRSVSFEPLR